MDSAKSGPPLVKVGIKLPMASTRYLVCGTEAVPNSVFIKHGGVGNHPQNLADSMLLAILEIVI